MSEAIDEILRLAVTVPHEGLGGLRQPRVLG